jgi:hypothetical protein
MGAYRKVRIAGWERGLGGLWFVWFLDRGCFGWGFIRRRVGIDLMRWENVSWGLVGYGNGVNWVAFNHGFL